MSWVVSCFNSYFWHHRLLRSKLINHETSAADLGDRPSPLFWVKKEEMTEGIKAGWASKIKPGPLLGSKSGSAAENAVRTLMAIVSY